MLNEDGTAQDPAAFQAALKSDQAKLEILRKEPETLAVMLGDNIPAMQSMLRSAFQVDVSAAVAARAQHLAKNHTCRRSKLDESDNRRSSQSVL